MKALTFLLLGVAPVAFADETRAKRVESESTELVRIAPGTAIRVANLSGDLIVEGWDRQDIEVTVLKWIDHEFKPEQVARAMQHLQDVSVKVDHSSADEIQISRFSAHSRKKVAIKCHIYAPRTSPLAIDHRGGYILFSGVNGDIDVANRRGDIVLMLPDPTSYAIDARNTFGIVTPDVSGTIKHKYLIGEQFARDHQPPAHHMRLRMGFGGITIKEMPPEAEAPVAAGSK